MPSSLRFILILLAVATVGAILSVAGIYGQDDRQARTMAEQLTGGSAAYGKAAIQRHGCGACHVIPGVSGGDGQVGPSLAGVATRTELAGRLANTPPNMRLWLRHPQQVVPGNGMPDMPLSEQEARDISAYLYTLR